MAALSVFFQKTKTGRALRAVADDHQAAQSIGIPLSRIWVIVWSVAGGVALVVEHLKRTAADKPGSHIAGYLDVIQLLEQGQ